MQKAFDKHEEDFKKEKIKEVLEKEYEETKSWKHYPKNPCRALRKKE